MSYPGTVVTSPQDHLMIKVRRRESQKKVRVFERKERFKPMRGESRKRCELNEILGTERKEKKKNLGKR
jgi:hypothetical protein